MKWVERMDRFLLSNVLMGDGAPWLGPHGSGFMEAHLLMNA